MTGNAWWEGYVSRWCSAVQCAADFRTYSMRTFKRQLGDWWKNGDTWCVHLDEWHYAVFDVTDQLDERLRHTLSLYLEAASDPSVPDWQTCALSWLRDLSDRTARADGFHGLLEQRMLAAQCAGIPQFPGYFVWLHFGGESVRTQLTSDIRANIEEIIHAFSPSGLVGWHVEDTGDVSALVYWHTDSESDEDDDEQYPSPPIKRAVEQLLNAIDADAMATARAAIGVPVRTPQSLFHGVATAVGAWRSREWFHQPGRVWLWGEQPLTVVLQAMDDAVESLFLEAAIQRSAADSLLLPSDLNEALQGLVAANLNVSEASRLLYLHRNTLMNRIERIRQSTGYDIRIFNDALVLWIVNLLRRREAD